MSSLYSSKDNLKAVIEQIAADFEPRILFAYVFGSAGTARQNSKSDLDIAVYLDIQASEFKLDHKTALYAEISRTAKRDDIDVLILNTCKNQMILYEVMTKGRLVYDADFEKRALFEQKTLHAAIDFKEHRERLFA